MTRSLVLGISAYVLAFGMAQAAPKNIPNCTTITESGSYVLTKNLVAAGNCLVVQADYVTIDLAGFTVAGDGTGEGITDQGQVRVAITVRDGFVTNFRNGIALAATRGTVVERVHSRDNANRGISLGEAAIVKNCVTSDNAGQGITVGSRSLVSGNISLRNGGGGIITALATTLSGNTVGLNALGISVDQGSTVANNTSRNNTTFGIFAECPSLILGNTTTANGTNFSPSPSFPIGCVVEHNAVAP